MPAAVPAMPAAVPLASQTAVPVAVPSAVHGAMPSDVPAPAVPAPVPAPVAAQPEDASDEEFTPVRAYNFKMGQKKLKCQIQWKEGGEDTWEFYTDVLHVDVVSLAYDE
jgi:hypothetical protein